MRSDSKIREALLWRLNAMEAAALLQSREISSRELVQSCLDRLDAVNALINAVVVEMRDQALADADAADAAQARGEPVGRLHGLPVTVKINTDQAGWPHNDGVAAYNDNIAERDAPVIDHMRREGAIFIGRTNAPAFSMRWFTGNALYGETRNPWAFDRTPGGSSGGAAAAVAVGIGPIAQGNDIAGSVRYPAYCCGVVGLRPTMARVPMYSPKSKSSLSLGAQFMAAQGPLARRVADAQLAFDVMAQPHPRDPRVMRVGAYPPPPPDARIAIVPSPSGGPNSAASIEAVLSAGRALEAAGYVVEEAEPPELEHAARLWGDIAGPDTLALVEPAVEAYGDEAVRRGMKHWRGAWPQRDPGLTVEAIGDRLRILRLWGAFFERYHAMILPTCTEPPFAWDEDTRDQDSMDKIITAQRTMLAVSVLGLPGLSVPTGVSDNLPTGVQIVAPPFREDICFLLGARIEAAHAMPTPIDPRGY